MPNDVFTIAGLTKSFGPVRVLAGVDLSLRAGEVTALMGANGAGKSTLVKIVSGVYRYDAGQLSLGGEAFAPASPADAMRAGVVTVHQNINDGVVADLDVATNLTLDQLSGRSAELIFKPGRVRRHARQIAERMGLDLDMRAMVGDLPLAERQMVAIARAMAHEPQVLILDEPTSSLSSAEADRLFDVVDRLRASGVAILYISHRMSDIRRVADRIVALRDGRIAGTFESAPLDYEGAVHAMLGRSIGASAIEVRRGDDPILGVRDLRLKADSAPFSFEARRGEIVVVTGLVGVGKTALAETLFGLRQPYGGHMTLGGRPFKPKTPRQAIDAGIFLLAKDRADNGIVPDFDISRNVSLPFLRNLSDLAVIRRGRERKRARDQIAALNVVCRGERDRMDQLSGGNQQKVMVGRWTAEDARLFILDEPFQGVDISARRDITAKLRASAQTRATIVFLTELDEVRDIADRILVMSEHTIVGEHANDAVDMDTLLAEIAGRASDGPARANQDIAP